MAKGIIWSLNAAEDRKSIFDYWNERTGSKSYSKKLNKQLKHIVKHLSHHPRLGLQYGDNSERYFISGPYQVFYNETASAIEILHVWDSRRNPDDLKI